MDDVLIRLATALGVPALTAETEDELLDCARQVAHTSARRDAPLSTFLVGWAVGAAQTDPQAAFRQAVATLREVVDPQP